MAHSEHLPEVLFGQRTERTKLSFFLPPTLCRWEQSSPWNPCLTSLLITRISIYCPGRVRFLYVSLPHGLGGSRTHWKIVLLAFSCLTLTPTILPLVSKSKSSWRSRFLLPVVRVIIFLVNRFLLRKSPCLLCLSNPAQQVIRLGWILSLFLHLPVYSFYPHLWILDSTAC